MIQNRKFRHAMAKSVKTNSDSFVGSSHGHTAVCVICEVARVPTILSALNWIRAFRACEY